LYSVNHSNSSHVSLAEVLLKVRIISETELFGPIPINKWTWWSIISNALITLDLLIRRALPEDILGITYPIVSESMIPKNLEFLSEIPRLEGIYYKFL